MAETRNQRIVRECEESGEPYFVLRAKDAWSTYSIVDYMKLAIGQSYAREFLDQLQIRLDEFRTWQKKNPQLVKFPDLREGE